MQSVGRSLRTIWIIAKQEFSLLFGSPLIYFIGAIWLLINGAFFSFYFGQQWNQGVAPLDMAPLINTMVFLMVFFAPAISMRLVADELREGTHELLFTSPIRDGEIIVGKWLGAFGAVAVFIAITLLYPVVLALRGSPDIGAIAAGYLGLLLSTGTMMAIGILASSLTQYQLVALFVGIGSCLVLWIVDLFAGLVANPNVSDFIASLSLRDHGDALIVNSIIDPVDIAYFIGMIIIALLLASQILGSRRYVG